MKFEINDDDVFNFAYAGCNKSFVDSLLNELDLSTNDIKQDVNSNISGLGEFDLSYNGFDLQQKCTFMIINTIYYNIKQDIMVKFNIDENEFTCDYSMSSKDDLWSDENEIYDIENAKIYISTRLKDYIVSVDSELAEKYLSLSFIEIN